MSNELSPAEHALREAARDYHRNPTRGKSPWFLLIAVA